jgi:hypothetical protein
MLDVGEISRRSLKPENAAVVELEAGSRSFRFSRTRDALVAVSTANLCLLGVWPDAFSVGPIGISLMKQVPGIRQLAAIALSVAFLGGLLYWPIRLAGKAERRSRLIGHVMLVPILTLVMFESWSVIASTKVYASLVEKAAGWIGARNTFALLGMAKVLFVAALIWGRSFRFIMRALLVLSSLVVANFGYAAYIVSHYPPHPEVTLRQSGARPERGEGRRIVWVVFDEWDFEESFTEREAGLDLPNLDAVQRGGVLFTDAHPTAEVTARSVLSSIYGRTIRDISSDGTHLRFDFGAGFEAEDQAGQGSVFAEADRRGRASAASGWFFPYGRLFGAYLTTCHSEEFTPFGAVRGSGLLETSGRYLARAAQWGENWAPVAKGTHVRTLRELLFHVLADVSDREISLVFAHMPIPHAPVIYDRKKAQIRTGYRSDCSYSDNLKLMDDTLGEIRRAIGQSEATPNMVLVLNADHRLRTRDKVGGQATARVPLLVELPLAREGMEIRTALCLSRLKSMILALLDGEIQTADGLRKWASRNEGACP